MSKKRSSSQPPQPPTITRRFQFHRLQLIGVPLLMILPILALVGTFGESVDSVHSANDQLDLQVTYPARFRYKMINTIEISVRNTSIQALPQVSVQLDRAYLENFSNVSLTPDVQSITNNAYVIELTDLQPQETQFVAVELQAEKYWRHHGLVIATPVNADEGVQVEVDTFIFP